MCGLPVTIQGKSRMREFRTYGSVRGAVSNDRPYRDSLYFAAPPRTGADSLPRRPRLVAGDLVGYVFRGKYRQVLYHTFRYVHVPPIGWLFHIEYPGAGAPVAARMRFRLRSSRNSVQSSQGLVHRGNSTRQVTVV